MSNGTAVNMIERAEPKFISFAAGDVVDGVLVNIERVKVKDKTCVRYTLRLRDHTFASFIGTWQLNTKLHIDDIGHYVSVACLGEDAMIKRGDNCMKVFKVAVSEKPVSGSSIPFAGDDAQVTDADRPF